MTIWSRVLGAAFFATILLSSSACASERDTRSLVAGKTVYRGMGIEEVQLEVFRAGNLRLPPFAFAKSGYHGSFAVRLPAGTYLIRARGTLPAAGGRRTRLRGTERLVVGDARIDRVVIQLTEEP